jgi:environmental stress-induced protein Ves
MGKTDVERAFQRLDTLTKEENLMMAARTFEVTHDVDVNVKATQVLTHHVDNKVTVIEEVLHQVDGNTRVTQELTCEVHAHMDVIKEDTRNVDVNVKVTKCGTPIVTVSGSL